MENEEKNEKNEEKKKEIARYLENKPKIQQKKN